MYEYVDVSDASDVFQNYIDPNTGAPFATNGKMTPDGFYQKIDSLDTDIAMIARQTVYGRFASVKSDGTFTGFAYAG